MIRRGIIVRVLVAPGRKARRASVTTGVALTNSFKRNGISVCPVGFFSRTYGGWVQLLLTQDLAITTATDKNAVRGPLPRSYRPEYRIWTNMRRRCSDPRNQGFYLYKNRVAVCAPWENSFDQFFKDMGPRPSPKHSLDRINNEGNYAPGNVRWATPKEQARNTSKTRFITACGKTKALTAWAEELGISPQSIKYRIDKGGWDLEAAVTRPKDKSHPYKDSLQSKRKRGSNHFLAKLDDAKVLEIRKAFRAGETQAALAKQFSVAYGTIAYVVHGKTWKHLLPKTKE